MQPFLLLVTLVISPHPPHSYQAEFSTQEACEKAAADLRADYYKQFRGAGVVTVCAKR